MTPMLGRKLDRIFLFYAGKNTLILPKFYAKPPPSLCQRRPESSEYLSFVAGCRQIDRAIKAALVRRDTGKRLPSPHFSRSERGRKARRNSGNAVFPVDTVPRGGAFFQKLKRMPRECDMLGSDQRFLRTIALPNAFLIVIRNSRDRKGNAFCELCHGGRKVTSVAACPGPLIGKGRKRVQLGFVNMWVGRFNMEFSLHLKTISISLFAHAIIVVAIALRVIMKRPATGVALAWLLLVAGIPYGGAVIYLLIGERRIGLRRAERIAKLRTDYRQIGEAAFREGLTDVDWSRHVPAAEGMDRLGRRLGGAATVRGSSFRMYHDTAEILSAIVSDVDAANTSLLMEFYIWNEGGAADEVLEAVIRAAKRGVSCRLLIDALGARPWWKGKQPQRLRDASVEVRPALPVGVFRTFVGRTDLRLHRKIVVMDGEVAWTGSMNLVDPRFFKQDSGVGQWVDAMVRVEGAVVAPLAAVMIGDWMLETGEPLRDLVDSAGLRLVAH